MINKYFKVSPNEEFSKEIKEKPRKIRKKTLPLHPVTLNKV
jgi:hypothetical protein